MILVFDSGVWISAFQFGGIPRAALRVGYQHHELAVCDQLLYEVQKTLAAKFGWSQKQFHEALEDYLDNIALTHIAGTLHGVCRDPKDDMILECAVVARASLIVSGDKDLLSLVSFREIRILTPRDFLQLAA